MLEARIKNRLRREVTQDFAWSDVVSAFQAASSTDKQNLVDAVKEGRGKAVSRDFMRVIKKYVDAQVQVSYDEITADGALSMAELERLFP